MAKALKRMLAAQLQADLEGSSGVLILDPGPMTVESAQGLRTDLREKAGGARLRVIHNRSARHAFEALYDGTESLRAELSGSSAVAFGGAGPIPIAKVVQEWQRKLKTLRVKAAIADGEVLLGDDAAALADMPDLPQLRAMLLSAVIGSARGIAASIQAVYGGLARCLKAHVDAQGGAPEEATDAPAPATDSGQPPAAAEPAAQDGASQAG